MKRITFSLVIFVLISLVSVCTVEALDVGDYKRSITLNPVTPQADYQVRVVLTTSNFVYSHAQNDGDDLRFYQVDDAPLEYWIETWNPSGTSTIWVNVSTSGTSTIDMYYGDPAASSESNGRDTFVIWDDFDGGSEQWTESDPSGLITIDRTTNKRINFALAGQTGERVTIDRGSDIGNFVLDYTMHISGAGNSNTVGSGVSDTLNWFPAWHDGLYGSLYIQRAGNQNFNALVVYSNNSITATGHLDEDFVGITYYYTLVRINSTQEGYIYNDAQRTSLKRSGTLSKNISDLRYVFAISNGGDDPGYTSTMTGWVDDIRLRKYSDPEPVASIGTEEHNATPGKPILKYPVNGSSHQVLDVALICTVDGGDDDDLNITFFNASNGSMISWNTVVNGSGDAGCMWRGLAYGSYIWYANASDGDKIAQSNNFTFTLAPATKIDSMDEVYIEPASGLGWGTIENTTDILEMIVKPYTIALGAWFYTIIMFSTVGMIYIKTQRVFIPSATMMLSGIVMASLLPGEVYGAAMSMMALGFTGVVYATFHKRL